MNAGEFKWLLYILELEQISPDVYKWKPARQIWAKMESQIAGSIFSRNGITAKSVKFTIPMIDISLHNALELKAPGSGHFFLTDINRETPGYFVLSTAEIAPVQCVIERTETVKGDNNRPEVSQRGALSFPGYVTEKYIRQTQQDPMSYSEMRYVLITPKIIDIQTGELIAIGGFKYEAVIPHTLEPHKNEYEILRRVDN